MDTITPVVEYVEGHLRRIYGNSLSETDMLNLLSGEGGVQVDVVLYLVSGGKLPARSNLSSSLLTVSALQPPDIHYLRTLTPLTNVVILLSQSDLLTPSQITSLKSQLTSQLHESSLRLFAFHPDLNCPGGTGIYAISSAPSADHETMDASLLMSPDYVQPLIPSDLSLLVSDLFSAAGLARLRHVAARKFLSWRASQFSLSSSACLSPPPPPFSLSPGNGMGIAQSLTGDAASTSYALARLADHARAEERRAQVRLANWAAELQKSLQRERERYAMMAREERAAWVKGVVGECVSEGVVSPEELGQLVPLREAGSRNSRGRRRSRREREKEREALALRLHASSQSQSQSHRSRQHKHRYTNEPQDPLGLLHLASDLKHKGMLVLEVLGSVGVLGGLVIWVARHYILAPWTGTGSSGTGSGFAAAAAANMPGPSPVAVGSGTGVGWERFWYGW